MAAIVKKKCTYVDVCKILFGFPFFASRATVHIDLLIGIFVNEADKSGHNKYLKIKE